MRVMIHKRIDGRADVLFVPSRHEARPPHMERGVTRTDLKERVQKYLDDMGAQKAARTAGG